MLHSDNSLLRNLDYSFIYKLKIAVVVVLAFPWSGIATSKFLTLYFTTYIPKSRSEIFIFALRDLTSVSSICS